MSKIGIYGGTFDPVHCAHLVLARDAVEQLQLEAVIFVPAAISPHKLERLPTSGTIRAEMLRAAIAGEPQFCLDEVELQRSPPSFTFDTIAEYVQSHPATEIHYLIGSDNLPRLHTWHRFDELAQMVRFVVLNRGPKIADCGYLKIERQVDISATQIRNRVASGLSIRYLVPPGVEEIIHRHQLYTEPTK